MADTTTGEMKKTLGLTGLTSNAMALIAPGAFLWLTFAIQGATGVTGPAMWAGIIGALVLCLATAVCYAEMAKLYPGTGSSYYFAEQSFLNHDTAWKYARLSKFIVGWASHLYYWIYPGVMVGVMGIFTGYIVGTLYPNFMSASNPGIFFMMAVSYTHLSQPTGCAIRRRSKPSAPPQPSTPSGSPRSVPSALPGCCSNPQQPHNSNAHTPTPP